jgi:transcriptional regulator with XRE-family HTH domain
MTGDELRAWRARHNYGLRTLAARLGRSVSTIQRWEAGEVIEGAAMLELALRGLECELRGHPSTPATEGSPDVGD